MLLSLACGTPSGTCAPRSRTRARRGSRTRTCLSSFLPQARRLRRRAFDGFLAHRRGQRRAALSPPAHSSTWPVHVLRKLHRSLRDKVLDMCAHHKASSRHKLRHSSSQSHNRCLSTFLSLRVYRRSRSVLVPCGCKEGTVQRGK
jgi:hypothetical protein